MVHILDKILLWYGVCAKSFDNSFFSLIDVIRTYLKDILNFKKLETLKTVSKLGDLTFNILHFINMNQSNSHLFQVPRKTLRCRQNAELDLVLSENSELNRFSV